MKNKVDVLLLEDDLDQAKAIEESLLKSGFGVAGIATNLKQAYGLYYSVKPDVVLVDIYIQNRPDGIVFAETINSNEETRKPLLFLTNIMDQQTFNEAMKTNPYSYLLKPFHELELKYAIQLAIEKFANDLGSLSLGAYSATYANKFFFVKTGNNLKRVSLLEIEYFAVTGRYIDIFTKKKKFTIQWSIKKLLTVLPKNRFLRIHRNYIVNVNLIDEVNTLDNEVRFGEQFLPISRRFKAALSNNFIIFK